MLNLDLLTYIQTLYNRETSHDLIKKIAALTNITSHASTA